MAIRFYKLMDYIARRGIKKTELAARAGLSFSTLAKLGKNEPVNLSIIDRICEALGCQPGDIMEYTPDD